MSGPTAGAAALAALLIALALAPADALAQAVGPDEAEQYAALLQRLTPAERGELEAYRKARADFEAQAAAFWEQVAEKKALRRAKRRMRVAIAAGDYVAGYPQEYAGPKLSPRIAELWDGLKRKDQPRPVPGVADMMAAAREHYGFVPEPIEEREFKRRYAAEALRLGLTKDQVVRVYALETGGQGNYDMQAGVSPTTRQGKPISSALGYAQLLHANSISEMVKHGRDFIARLERAARGRGVDPAHVATLQAKAQALARMLQVARKVPNEWSDHIRLAGTPEGLGIHAINLDADIGPWLQVLKLEGLRQTAARNGMPRLSGAELELMNLAGPGTALEMMQPAARDASTVNFFSRRGYEINSVVRQRTSAELLAELDRRMVANLERPGAKEFATVFDEVMASRQARR